MMLDVVLTRVVKTSWDCNGRRRKTIGWGCYDLLSTMAVKNAFLSNRYQ